MGDTYGRPSGQPDKKAFKVGREGIDSPTTAGSKGLDGIKIPSGGGTGATKNVVSPTTQGNKGTNEWSTKAPTAKPTLD